MSNHLDNLRDTIARLRRTGEYDQYLGPDAEAEAAAIALRFQDGVELTDEEVGRLWDALPKQADLTEAESRAEAKAAIDRVTVGSGRLVDAAGRNDLADRMKNDPKGDQ